MRFSKPLERDGMIFETLGNGQRDFQNPANLTETVFSQFR
jgi:hypothetical protein